MMNKLQKFQVRLAREGIRVIADANIPILQKIADQTFRGHKTKVIAILQGVYLVTFKRGELIQPGHLTHFVMKVKPNFSVDGVSDNPLHIQVSIAGKHTLN